MQSERRARKHASNKKNLDSLIGQNCLYHGCFRFADAEYSADYSLLLQGHLRSVEELLNRGAGSLKALIDSNWHVAAQHAFLDAAGFRRQLVAATWRIPGFPALAVAVGCNLPR